MSDKPRELWEWEKNKMKDEPAFPIDPSFRIKINGETRSTFGLTKREYFAGLAMQGYLGSMGNHDVTKLQDLTMASVVLADALLAELEKEK